MAFKQRYELIIWKDAASQDEWHQGADIKAGFHTIRTMGLVIDENKKAVAIALNKDETADNYSCVMHIPLEMIVTRRVIRVKV